MARTVATRRLGEPGGSLSTRAAELGLTPPYTLRQILDAFDADIIFEQQLDTASTLSGSFRLVLHRDGGWEFTGHFHASSVPSFTASLLVTVGFELRLPPGRPGRLLQVALAARGTAHGTLEDGDRNYIWNQLGENQLFKANWGRVRNATLSRRLEYDSDWFGQIGDMAAFLGEIVLMNGVLGPSGVAIALVGEAAGMANVDEIMLPGLVGLGAVAGAVYFISPNLVIPAFIAGALATPLLIKQSPLSQAERDFADTVFEGTIPYNRLIKTNALGAQDRAFVMPLPGNAILLNLGDLCYDDPVNYDGWGTSTGDAAPGQLFIHELTHAWQIAHDSFTPCLYCRGAATAVASLWDDSLYSYGGAERVWSDLGIEQQAQAVCEWFAGNHPNAGPHAQSAYAPMRDDSPPSPPDFGPPNPYFHYVRDHIRAGIA